MIILAIALIILAVALCIVMAINEARRKRTETPELDEMIFQKEREGDEQH